MPTTKPRYTFTDTDDLKALLDQAEGRWPEITDRKMLLLKLVEEGARSLGLEAERIDAEERHARAEVSLKRIRALVDVEVLLGDHAWR